MAGYLGSNCKRPFPENDFPHRCPHCGGVFTLEGEIAYSEKEIESAQPGIWRHRHTFGLSEKAPVISLGEGDTPLVDANALDRKLHFKLEFLNPSGSFKDSLIELLSSFAIRKCKPALYKPR